MKYYNQKGSFPKGRVAGDCGVDKDKIGLLMSNLRTDSFNGIYTYLCICVIVQFSNSIFYFTSMQLHYFYEVFKLIKQCSISTFISTLDKLDNTFDRILNNIA